MTDFLPAVVLDALKHDDPRVRAGAQFAAGIIFAGLLLRFLAWRRRATDVRIWNEMIADSPNLTPEEKAQQIRSNPPPEIPTGQNKIVSDVSVTYEIK